jgi:hypothetical protein
MKWSDARHEVGEKKECSMRQERIDKNEIAFMFYRL